MSHPKEEIEHLISNLKLVTATRMFKTKYKKLREGNNKVSKKCSLQRGCHYDSEDFTQIKIKVEEALKEKEISQMGFCYNNRSAKSNNKGASPRETIEQLKGLKALGKTVSPCGCRKETRVFSTNECVTY